MNCVYYMTSQPTVIVFFLRKFCVMVPDAGVFVY